MCCIYFMYIMKRNYEDIIKQQNKRSQAKLFRTPTCTVLLPTLKKKSWSLSTEYKQQVILLGLIFLKCRSSMMLFVSCEGKNSPLPLWLQAVCSGNGSSCFRMCWGNWRGGKLIWRASQKAVLRSRLWWKGARLPWRRSCVSLMLAGAEFGPGPRTGVTPCW